MFWSFRIMVGMGVLMLLLAGGPVPPLMRRSRTPRWLLWVFAGFTFSGWVATLAGWIVTEIGRQPWLVTACCAPPTRSAKRAAPSSARA